MINREKTDNIMANKEYGLEETLNIMEDLPDDSLKLINSFMKNIKTVTKLADLLSLSKKEAKKYYEEAIEEDDEILAVIFHYKYILELKKEN